MAKSIVSSNTKNNVVLKNWGIQYKKSKFDLSGDLYGHKTIRDGKTLSTTSGIVNATIDYGERVIKFETHNTLYICSFDEYISRYLNECESRWTKGSASPEVFDDIIEQMVDKNSKLHNALMSGMIGAMVNNIKGKMDAVKDIPININIDDIMQNNFENNNHESVNTLKKHMGNDIKFTGAWDKAQNIRQLQTDELLPGEMSAMTYEIGGYTVRNADRVYKRLEDFTEIPADNETIELAKEQQKRLFGLMGNRDRSIKITNEISAMRTSDISDAFSDGFKLVCQATNGIHVFEEIHFICSILTPPSFSLNDELLFVKRCFMGDSISAESWFCLNPQGVVTSFRIHPFASHSFTAKWIVASNEANA